MTTIAPENNVCTLINVFHVVPENQQALAELLVGATEKTMRHLPGFISVNIHRSLDGKRVVNYAQWGSKEDFQGALHDPEAQTHMAKAAALAESYDPVVCEVIEAIS